MLVAKNIIVVLIWGVVLRGIYLGTTPFGFDQIQIISNAQKIIGGHLTLLGPRTGQAEMFIGPLTYYFAVPFVLFVPPESVTAVAAVFWSLITGLCLIYLGKKYTDQNTTFSLLLLWAFSPFMLLLDRIPWNPNTTFLAAALVFFPLLKKQPLKILDLGLICAGLLIGYQSHFSGLLLFVIAAAGLIYRRQFKMLLGIGLSFIITLLPTIIFDLRHDWLNWHGFASLMLNKDRVAFYLILPRFLDKTKIVLETTGKVFLVDTKFYAQFVIGSVIWVFTFYDGWLQRHNLEKNKNNTIGLIFATILVIFFALYRTATPEYYFLILLPVILWITAKLIGQINFISPWLIVLIFGVYSTWFVYNSATKTTDLNLESQTEIAHQLVDISHQYPLTEVVYDMRGVDSLGLQYLSTQYPPQLVTSGYKIHIVYPALTNQSYIQKSGPIGLWLDPRVDQTKTYFTLDKFMVGIPKTWQLDQVLYPDAGKPEYEAYNLIDPATQKITQLRIYPLSFIFDQVVTQNNHINFSTLPDNKWTQININTGRVFFQKQANLGMVLLTEDEQLASGVELLRK